METGGCLLTSDNYPYGQMCEERERVLRKLGRKEVMPVAPKKKGKPKKPTATKKPPKEHPWSPTHPGM